MKRLLLFVLFGLTLTLSEKRQKVVDCAKSKIGTPYETLDCSGLTRFCYRKVGIELSTIAHNQFRHGKAVSKDNLKPGDIVGYGPKPYHTFAYAGKKNGKDLWFSAGPGDVSEKNYGPKTKGYGNKVIIVVIRPKYNSL